MVATPVKCILRLPSAAFYKIESRKTFLRLQRPTFKFKDFHGIQRALRTL